MKKAIVMGASSGIGKELAYLLVQDGYKVGVTGRRTSLLNEMKIHNPESYIVRTFDAADTQAVASHLQSMVVELGGLDLFIICAGTGDINDQLDFEIEKRTIDTNVSGFTVAADWAFNFFEQQQYGHLVGISSIWGLRGSRQAPAYSATKAYQINYLEGLRQRARKTTFPIFISDIRPGLVDTAMAKGDGLFWVAPLAKATGQIYKAIIRRKKIAYVTKRWYLIALVMRCLPNCVFDRM